MRSKSERDFYAKFNSLPAEKVAEAKRFADEMLRQQASCMGKVYSEFEPNEAARLLADADGVKNDS